MHGNSVKILIGVFIASVLLFIVTSPLLMIQTESAAIITCVIFQAFTTVVIGRLCGKVKPWQLFVTILIGSSIIDLYIRIRYFAETLGSFRIFVGILCLDCFLMLELEINLKSKFYCIEFNERHIYETMYYLMFFLFFILFFELPKI